GLEQQPAAGLEVETLRVAVAVREDLGSDSRAAHERVVGWHRAVVVESQRLARERVETLGQFPPGGVPGGDVELPVWPEAQARAGMYAAGRDPVEDDGTLRQCPAALAEPHDTDLEVAIRAVRIGEIEAPVLGDARLKRETH